MSVDEEIAQIEADRTLYLGGRARPRPSNRRSGPRQRARALLWQAVGRGEVAKPVCCEWPGCCETRIQAHHHDYSRPLSVIWLCRRHHNAAHRP